ncbi:hypothetical protein BMT54_03960 [Pasteurellaceae bacterium 15-036681]|nr:hypothetical protein BMT54_03960 [Pasteurellaceae bacterium 15-036681]
MENRIISGYMNEGFKKDYGVTISNEAELFEMFVNYCIISKIHPEAFSTDFEKIESMNIGGGEDTGIDGLAIIVNDHLISDIDEIKDFKQYYNKLEVKFIFIQAKTSPKFESEKIGTFIFGVKDFFREKPSLKFNENIKDYRKLKDFIYENSLDFRGKPICQMYYVTTGIWNDDKNVLGRAEQEKQDLEKLGIFSKVEFIPIDADKLGDYYREIKNKVEKEIIFEKRTVLPSISGVKESYIGVIPLTEYIKLIQDSDGNIQRNLFYDNVRDFLGENSVNNEIKDTIINNKEQDKFAILNNGVTIVAKSIEIIGDKFIISDFQIVNGCQTSHVIFYNKGYLEQNKNASIPIKLIVTDNYEVANQITKATNRQTEVKIEAFTSLEPYHRRLEEYFNSYSKDERIYYARRSNQYDNVIPPIPKEKVITLAAQINAFISMFLNAPHSTHRYYGELLKANKGKIFNNTHNLDMYYISSFTLHKIEKLLKNKDYKLGYIKKFKLKYHLLLVIRIIISGFMYPNPSSKKMSDYCNKIHKILLDNDSMLKVCEIASDIIKRELNKLPEEDRKDSHRKKSFTSDIINESKKHIME